MKITFEDVSPEHALLMLSALYNRKSAGAPRPAVSLTDPLPERPDDAVPTVEEASEVSEASAEDNEPTEEDYAAAEASIAAIKSGASNIATPATVRDRLAQDRKIAKTVTIDGKPASEGTEAAVAATGEVGVIFACFRGYAVLEFEDGRGEAHKGSELTLVLQEDADGEDEEVIEVEDAEVEDVEIEEAAVAATAEVEEVTEAMVREKAREVLAVLKGPALVAILEEHGGTREISKIPADKLPAVYEALASAAAS